MPPIKDLPEEITELAKSEEQAIAEVGCQGGQIWNCDHFFNRCRSDLKKKKKKKKKQQQLTYCFYGIIFCRLTSNNRFLKWFWMLFGLI